jgi:hypothetical protein
MKSLSCAGDALLTFVGNNGLNGIQKESRTGTSLRL